MAAAGSDRVAVLEQQQKKMMAVLEGMQSLLNEHLKPLETPRPSEWEPIVRKLGNNIRITSEEFAVLKKFTNPKLYTKLEDICGSIKENFRKFVKKNMKAPGSKKKLDCVTFTWEQTMRHLSEMSKAANDTEYQQYFTNTILPYIEAQQPKA